MLKLFNSDTYMLYFLVIAKFLQILIMLRVRTSNNALVRLAMLFEAKSTKLASTHSIVFTTP